MSDTMTIVPLAPEHAPQVADIHITCIGTGFLSSLGPAFLSELYRAIASCPVAFGHVAMQGGKVLGFIACTTSVGGLYKRVLLRRGWRLAIPLMRFTFSVRTVKRILQTLLYPSRMKDDFPAAEILSVAVRPQARGRGLASELMKAALEGLRQHGCSAAKVVVGAANEAANRYYLKEGFRLAGTFESHGIPTNVYVRDGLTASSP